MLNCRVKECDLTDHATSASQPDDSLRDKKLKLAGYSYLLGDAALAMSGMLNGQQGKAVLKTGAIWGIGGLAAARYGNPNTEKRLEILSDKLESHLRKQGITIPASVREQNALLQQQGFFKRMESFLYEHPSEILNAAYALGAGVMLHSGIREGRTKGFTQSPDFWSGALVLAGALGGLLLKEDPQAREKAKDGGIISKAKAYFAEKPLRWSGSLYFLNNFALLGRVVKDSKLPAHASGLKPHYFSAVTLASYVFSNAMLALSSRNQLSSTLPATHIAQLEDAAARILAAQPVEMQQALLSDMSHYLAEQKGINQNAPHIAQALANRLTELTGERAQQAANQVSWVERAKSRDATPAEQAERF